MTGGSGGNDQEQLHFAPRMTAVEELMWRLGRQGARYRSTMSLVVSADGPIPVDALAARLSEMSISVPRLGERVQEPPVALARPVWEPDPEFCIGRHLEARRGELWEVASSTVAEPFEEGRPPWRVVVASSSPEAIVLHMHHSYTDGLGGVRLLGELFDLDSGPPTRRRNPAPPLPGSGPGSFLDDLESEVARAMGIVSRVLPWAARTVAAARRQPAEVLGAVSELASSLQFHASALAAAGSPLLAARSDGVLLAPLSLELEAMRALARRLGATVNDVFLAGLLDGLQRYHAKHGSVAPAVRLALPISSRGSETEMQNQVFGAVMRGPLGHLDFDERIRLVHEIVRNGRRQPWAGLLEDLTAGAVRLPGAVQLVAAAMASLDVVASNVIGPPVPMWLAGRSITSMTPIGPRSGSALNATLLSYRGLAAIGLNIDPAAFPDPDVLVDCLTAAFEEGLAV